MQVGRGRLATQLGELALNTRKLGALLGERSVGGRALADERGDPAIQRFELDGRRRVRSRLRTCSLELGARLEERLARRFELVHPHLQLAARLFEL
ncbi:MAG TPA: hypothetical protein VFJ70_17710, partial [Burkholderiales bacterium]|nr:hypothetical protein [Burkholderiales bacterium]